ncbi:MFS transporter [Streptomyces sp. A1-5]|uniref:MFS transporter n=1 Tax=Streptomyces sp. A1-5 TaxID=2738410 RepID=UPI003FA7B7E3
MAAPTIMADLHLRADDLNGLFAGYGLAFGGLLLLGGQLADLVGRKRMLIIGLAGFAVAGVVGGLAATSGMLLSARALQGVFAALLSPAALALVSADFPEPKARGRAFGIYAAIAVGGSTASLLVGGWLVEFLSWRWCLLIDVPLALIAVLGVATVVHDRPVRTGPRFDAPGLLLGSGGIAALVYGFQQTGSRGWADLLVLALLALGVALLIAFFWWQTRADTPLLPPYALGDRDRVGSFATLFLAGAGTLALLPTLTAYLENVRGYSPMGTALAILPTAVAVVIGATQVSARLLHRIAPRTLIVPGLLLTALGLALLTFLTPDSQYAALVLPGMVLAGLGLGTALTPLLSLATAGLAAPDAGGGAAVAGAANQVGGVLGAALFGSVLSSAIAARMERVPGLGPNFAEAARSGRLLNPRGVPPQLAEYLTHATLGGYATALWWSVGITLLAGLAAALLIRSAAPALPRTAPPRLRPAGHPLTLPTRPAAGRAFLEGKDAAANRSTPAEAPPWANYAPRSPGGPTSTRPSPTCGAGRPASRATRRTSPRSCTTTSSISTGSAPTSSCTAPCSREAVASLTTTTSSGSRDVVPEWRQCRLSVRFT